MLSHKRLVLHVAALALCASLLAGCGTSSRSSTPPPPAEVKVAISPSTVSSVINQTTQFTATVTGTSNTAVTWTIKEQNAGTISAGLYKAPIVNGTYHVIATSVADSSKSAGAEVAISAPFLFIQQYDEGDAQPYSVTPIVGTFGPDTKFTTTNLIDASTGKPLSAALDDISLAPDGTKGISSKVDAMTATDGSTYYVENIYVASGDGSNPTALTNNSIDGQNSWMGQFTPDGKQIIYMNYDPATACDWEIWMMNADGSAKAPVYSNPNCDASVYHPTVSPDMTKIAFEMWRDIGEQYYDGIAIMNIDGTNIIQLTGAGGEGNGGGEVCPNNGVFWWDEYPSFTADGKQLLFERFCWAADDSGWQSSIHSINVDGTGLKVLVSNPTSVLNMDPLVVGDKVVFPSDVDTPGTGAFDLYSVKLDGTGITRLTTNTLRDVFTSGWMEYWSGGHGWSALQRRSGKLHHKLNRQHAR